MNTVNTHMYIPTDLYDQIDLAARENNVSFAEMARELMAESIKRHSKKTESKSGIKWLTGFKFKGPTDLSTNHDEYLYE